MNQPIISPLHFSLLGVSNKGNTFTSLCLGNGTLNKSKRAVNNRDYHYRYFYFYCWYLYEHSSAHFIIIILALGIRAAKPSQPRPLNFLASKCVKIIEMISLAARTHIHAAQTFVRTDTSWRGGQFCAEPPLDLLHWLRALKVQYCVCWAFVLLSTLCFVLVSSHRHIFGKRNF